MPNEIGSKKMTKGRKYSPSVDESCSDGSVEADGTLKKGPWTSAEDAILTDYIKKHGEGNWNAVQKHSGLSRCGKSCRLRWANHLRPDLKKGAFTQEEERCIIELHAMMGNKWARMAAEMPGRTDNEIKNYWNTRIKRLQRTGSPIYPPDVCLPVLNGNREGQHMGTLEAGDTHHSYWMEGDCYEIPEVEFQNLELDQGIYSYRSPLLDIPASSIIEQTLNSSHNFSFTFPTMLPTKCHQESETLFPCADGSSTSCSAYPFGSSSPFDPDFNYNHQLPFGGVIGSHAGLNGNCSSSEPIHEAMMKSELPSLQYSENQRGSWDSLASSLPSHESVDTLIQSPPTKRTTQTDCHSPRSTGLLEAVLYESQALKRPRKSSNQQNTDTSTMPSDPLKEWEIDIDREYHLGYSVASEFSEYTPISQSSADESQMAQTMPGCDGKPKEVCYEVSAQNQEKKELPKMDFSSPYALYNWSWIEHDEKHSNDNCILSDAIGALLGGDYISDHH